MATITVKTPFQASPLKVIWEDRKVRIRGNKNALLYWSDIKSRGMNGMYGHIVDFQDTPISDIVVALQNRVPADDISLDQAAKDAMAKEAKESKPFPKGAVS